MVLFAESGKPSWERVCYFSCKVLLMEAGVQGWRPWWLWGWGLCEEEPPGWEVQASEPCLAAFPLAPCLLSLSLASGRTVSGGPSWLGAKEAATALAQWSCPLLGLSLHRAT